MLEIKNLSKEYSNKLILNDINVKLQPSTIYALVGPNGSGKTTFLNCITNVISKDKGTVTIDGLKNTDIKVYNKISYCSDDKILYPYLTGRDHLLYACKIYRKPLEKVNEIARLFEIEHYYKKKVLSYSLGMKQKLLLALALINDPDYIILDEPLNGLDPTTILFLRDQMIKWKDSGKMILMSSHLLNEIEMVTSNILFLKEGRLINENFSENEKGFLEKRYKELFL